MDLKKIDFKHLAPKTGDQRTSFEELCCQIALYSDNVPKDSKPHRLRGDGGDGGVEFYWELPNGEEWGWQAKYVFDLGKVKTQAKKSFETAMVVHPRLTRYFICIPFDLTGNTKRGKGETEKWEEFKKELEQLAKNEKRKIEVVLEQRFELLDKLLQMDPSLGRIRFWFEKDLFSEKWFGEHVATTVNNIPRYTPKLKVDTDLFRKLMAFTQTGGWADGLKKIYEEFKDKAYYWSSTVETKDDKGWGAKFPEELVERGKVSVDKVNVVKKVIEDLLVQEIVPSDVTALLNQIDDATTYLRELSRDIRAQLVEQHGEAAVESANFRQWNAEWMVSFPMANLDSSKDLINLLEQVRLWVKENYIDLYNSKLLLLTGGWGVGKTFAICDLAELRRVNKQLTVLLFGDGFIGGTEPWVKIQEQLGINFDSKEALFEALETSAETSGFPLLLCIDAINETEPKSYWQKKLRLLAAEIEKYPNLNLCVSCRTSYKDYLVRDEVGFIEAKHPGFKGIENEAVNAFFNHFGIKPPSTPIIHPEFSNPLFLKLVCQTLQAKGLKQMPKGWQGINTVIQAFLDNKNREYGEQNGIDKRHKILEKALQSFVGEAKRLQKSLLTWDEANTAVGAVLKESGVENSTKTPLLDWLIDEHLLFVDAAPAGSNKEREHVRISFERLGDHLLASSFIEGKDESNLKKDFLSEGDLNFLVADASSIESNRGLLEALSIQIPERFNLELSDIVENDILVQISDLVIEQLHWRDPSYFGSKTKILINRALRNQKSYLAFDALLLSSFTPSDIDAYFLDDLLRAKTMIQRDPYWCGYLYSRYGDNEEGKDLVKRILNNSLNQEIQNIPEDRLERWCITLGWFCAAADRRIRDGATKALINITQTNPAIWEKLLKHFGSLDDDYIIERTLAAAYGVLLLTRHKPTEKKLAKVVDNVIFSKVEVIHNAVIRDYARCIIELAILDKAMAKKDVKNAFLTPYASDPKLLRIPSDKEIEDAEPLVEKTKLKLSCFSDDFFNYTLGSLRQYDHFMNKKNMAKWVFIHIVNLGYSRANFENYEGYMMFTHGGGRGKPIWAERIGKKYQWMALFRLAGLLSDNVEIKADSWEPEPLVTPLSFERGRQIDPSILVKEPQTQAFYDDDLFCRYNFDLKEKLSDEEWIKFKDDLPTFGDIQKDHGGKDHILLNGHMDQSNKGEFDKSNSKHRRFWMLIDSYLVNQDDIEKAWNWLSKKNFMGRWMPDGAEHHDGFIGEYPWGTPFNIYKDSYLSYGRDPDNEKFPCTFFPTDATLHSSEEYDSSGHSNFVIKVPSKIFFEKSKLEWNNVDGYKSGNKLVFLDPSICSKRKGALLVEKKYLRNFLDKNGYVLIWTVLAEKLIMGIDNSFIRQTFNQIHLLNNKGEFESSVPNILVK